MHSFLKIAGNQSGRHQEDNLFKQASKKYLKGHSKIILGKQQMASPAGFEPASPA
jgi:hypothetical protein